MTIRNPNHFEIFEWFTHPASSGPIHLALPAHEFGHLLIGVPDFYHATSSSYAGVYSIMSTLPSDCCTSHFDPFVKLKSQWLDYGVIAGAGTQTFTLRNIEQYGEALILYDPTRGKDEYYVLEYRRPGTSYDAGRASGAAAGLPAAGLAIWQIIENPSFRERNVLAGAANFYEKGVRLVRADPSTPLKDGKALFTASSGTIYLKWSDGSDTGFQILVQPDAPCKTGCGGFGLSFPPDSIRLIVNR